MLLKILEKKFAQSKANKKVKEAPDVTPGKGTSSKAFNALGALLLQQRLWGRWGIYSQGDFWCRMGTNQVVLLQNYSISLKHFLQIKVCCLEIRLGRVIPVGR